MTFAEWLKQARKYHGMTYDDLAAKAGISKSYAFDVENDACVPSITVASKIAAAFNMRLSHVLKKMEREE